MAIEGGPEVDRQPTTVFIASETPEATVVQALSFPRFRFKMGILEPLILTYSVSWISQPKSPW
jgi:hypothetical protein